MSNREARRHEEVASSYRCGTNPRCLPVSHLLPLHYGDCLCRRQRKQRRRSGRVVASQRNSAAVTLSRAQTDRQTDKHIQLNRQMGRTTWKLFQQSCSLILTKYDALGPISRLNNFNFSGKPVIHTNTASIHSYRGRLAISTVLCVCETTYRLLKLAAL